MKYISLLFITLFICQYANAQGNYSFTNTKINSSTYTDIESTGTAIPMTNAENGNSTTPQSIGFNFTFNGSVFTEVMIHADGVLKFGNIAPGASTVIAPSPFNSYANVFTNTTTAFQNIVMPLFLDLVQGIAAPKFHIATTGTAPNRITTIQWKNLRDADNLGSTLQHQFENMEFQVKLYETTNNIEMAYGTWLQSSNISVTRGSAIGIKASSSNFISYTKSNAIIKFDYGNFEDPASTNSRIFLIEKAVSPINGTSFMYFVRLANDINVAKLYVDDAAPQTPTIGKNIQALIKNEGTSANTNIPVTLTVAGANSYTETILIANLSTGGSQVVSFTPFVAAAKGLQTVTISVNPTVDDRVENNSLQTNQTVTQNVVKLYNNDKKSTSGVGFNAVTSMFATKIFGTGTRNLSQIRTSFNTNNILVDVRIYEDNGTSSSPSSSPLFISPTFRTNNQNEVVVPVSTGIAVTGDYYIVVAQREASNMALSFFNQYPKLPQKIYTAALDASTWGESPTSFNPLFTVIQETDAVDIGFETITSPRCAYTNNEIVKATIRNFSNQVHNYATNPVTVTGFVKDEVTNTTVPFNFIKNTGTIAAGGRDTVTLLNSYNFTSKGNHIFSAKTICTADAESINDSVQFAIFTKITFSGVPIDSICPNTSVTISIASPYLRSPLNFTSASDGSTFSPTATLTVSPNATTTYYASGVDYRGCTLMDSVVIKVKSLGVPEAPIIATVDSILSYKNDFSIVVTVPALAGHTIIWQSSNTGGVATNGGTTYTFSATSSFGGNVTHKAFYTRLADGCSSVFSNIITTSYATGLLISDAVTTVCDTSFYDNGGFTANHTNNNFTKTYTPTDAGKKLKLTINKFSLAQFGRITIYDGDNVFANRIGRIDNTTAPAVKYEFVSSNPSGNITIEFVAGGIAGGFLGSLTCQTPLQFRSIANGVFTDKNIWESRPISSNTFSPATRFPNKGDDSIWVMHNVNINKSIPLDQLVVEPTGNVEVTGVNTDIALYKTIPDNELTIKGIFKNNTGTFVGRNSTNILLLGTLINNISMETDSVKVFENSTAAIISGNGTIGKLIVNNSQGLLVNGNLKIENNLSLLNGIVKVNAANFLTMVAGFSPIIEGGNANSYIEGILRRQEFSSTNPILFPLGVNGLYRPVTLLANQNSFDNDVEYEAKMVLGAATTRSLPITLAEVNSSYYHNITLTKNPSNFVDATIKINYNTGDGVFDAANLRIAKDNGGSNWLDIGGIGTANNNGNITSNTFTSFSDFILANSTGGLNTLPLTLLSFTGKKINNTVMLQWKTTNEINTLHFEIERSKEGVAFEKIGRVTAANTSSNNNYMFKDATPLLGNNYYRLKQIDIDGRFTYSKIVAITFQSIINSLIIYPNPVVDWLYLQYPITTEMVALQILDNKGAVVKAATLQGVGTQKVLVQALSKGIYWVRLIVGTNLYTQVFVKE